MNKFSLPPEIRLAAINLKTASLDKMIDFYVNMMGFTQLHSDEKTSALSLNGKNANLVLTRISNPAHTSLRSTGLYHTAFLVPDRYQLALIFEHLLASGVRFQGFADHGVSEALYLSDPDKNGIEIYHDKPSEMWKRNGSKIQMSSDPLDLENLMGELQDRITDFTKLHPDTKIGHIHLKASDLNKAELFYSKILNFDITQADYEGALFMSAGGYHHHLGFNTWTSRGAENPNENSTGLKSFAIEIPGNYKDLITENLIEAGVKYNIQEENGKSIISTNDLEGNKIELIITRGNHET